MSQDLFKEKRAQKAEAKRLNDVAVNRVMILFALVFISVFVMIMMADRFAKNEDVFVLDILPWVQIGLGVLTVAAGVWCYICKKKGTDETYRILKSTYLLGTAVTLLIPALLYNFIGMGGVIAVMIGGLVLCYVHNFYPRDFELYSYLTAAGAVCLYAASLNRANPVLTLTSVIKTGATAVAILLGAAAIVVVLLAKSGKISCKKCRKALPHNTQAYPFLIGGALMLAGGVLAFFWAVGALYAVYALLAAYLVIAIVYSIKMI